MENHGAECKRAGQLTHEVVRKVNSTLPISETRITFYRGLHYMTIELRAERA